MSSGRPTHSIILRRLGAFGVLCCFLGAAVILLLSDRAGAMFGQVVDIVVNTGRRVEQRYDVDVIDRSSIPGDADEIGHALFWGTGMLLVGWFLRHRLTVLLSAMSVALLSLVFELAQPMLSTTRAVEPSDAVANVLGVSVAALFLAAVLALMRLWPRADEPNYGEITEPVEQVYEPTDEYFLNL